MDARLAAVIWLLAEAGVPVLVASRDGLAAESLAAALEVFGRPPTLLATFPSSLEADSLEEVFERLAAPPWSLTDDAVRSVGVVLVLRASADGLRRVVAAHYVRPLEQDPHGHVQRRPPALLAAWDGQADRFDEYSWGILAELAGRVGQSVAAFEAARAARTAELESLTRGSTVVPEAPGHGHVGHRHAG
jgi:hypothetical protein